MPSSAAHSQASGRARILRASRRCRRGDNDLRVATASARPETGTVVSYLAADAIIVLEAGQDIFVEALANESSSSTKRSACPTALRRGLAADRRRLRVRKAAARARTRRASPSIARQPRLSRPDSWSSPENGRGVALPTVSDARVTRSQIKKRRFKRTREERIVTQARLQDRLCDSEYRELIATSGEPSQPACTRSDVRDPRIVRSSQRRVPIKCPRNCVPEIILRARHPKHEWPSVQAALIHEPVRYVTVVEEPAHLLDYCWYFTDNRFTHAQYLCWDLWEINE
ncbi:uncharacterized protein LOC144095370 [Amblyomma americanum]